METPISASDTHPVVSILHIDGTKAADGKRQLGTPAFLWNGAGHGPEADFPGKAEELNLVGLNSSVFRQGLT